ncbi:prepilin-type N-terminal cleavage/methylation domain-containing protein [Sphingomonas sp. IC-56]|uniref:prepilin-type N-terminal cleavage/methylation domain-containing protein n=1 Tax=Sphingomonas sp. IC-56 TaxID=2898529 RepID=UPI001E522DC8|nr:prepilin-type N-terminal cleavage/methylation domain-containing protein [Sphingomonas sp. IC-56]MCD2325095.1 prepilin-type N-terminal cleavage/methylation domain-containing protein [Sphingomonas sp. IC-56]
MRGGVSIGKGHAEAGMTLIEMLIVLVIIGVAAGAVTLGIGAATRAPTVETEARRLAMRLQAAADDAMLGDRMIAFTAEKHGYGFATIGPDGRMIARTDDALAFHRLPDGIVVTLSAKPPVMLGVDGAGRPLSATIERGDQRWRVSYDGLTASAAPAPRA